METEKRDRILTNKHQRKIQISESKRAEQRSHQCRCGLDGPRPLPLPSRFPVLEFSPPFQRRIHKTLRRTKSIPFGLSGCQTNGARNRSSTSTSTRKTTSG